jgi:hypothetical protein
MENRSYMEHEHFGRLSFYLDVVFPHMVAYCHPPHHCTMESALPRPQEGIYLYLPARGPLPHVNPGTKAHWTPDERGGKGVLASDLKLLRYFGIDPGSCCEGLVDIAIGAGEQAEYEAFLIAHRSQMRLTSDQRPASPCLD